MNLGLTDKRVLITGGSRGIGLAIAGKFLSDGAKVALVARTAGPLEEAAQRLTAEHGSGRVLIFPADCADADAWPPLIDQLRSTWGGLDVVIANAGNGRGIQEALPDAARIRSAWRNNFETAEVTARATLPLLEASGGSLLFISSIAGLEVIDAPTEYSVAKTALIALGKHMARRLAPRIRVNCVAPGHVMFSEGGWDARYKSDPKGVAALIEATVPMNRFGTPEEVADAVLFLCSERAHFITGACLVVDGGHTLGIL